MRRGFFIIALVLLSIFQYRPSSAANIDTSLRFSTIETEHFSIHFHQGIEELAQKAAAIAEGVHTPLGKEFNWAPREKTQLVLTGCCPNQAHTYSGSAIIKKFNEHKLIL